MVGRVCQGLTLVRFLLRLHLPIGLLVVFNKRFTQSSRKILHGTF